MPEKGWSILTVRERTAKKVKELAHAKGLTVDEFINELMNPSGKGLVDLSPLWGQGQIQESP
jgi:hypothetical protein